MTLLRYPQTVIRCQGCARVWDGDALEWTSHPGLLPGEGPGWCPACFQFAAKQRRIKRARSERATERRIAQGFGLDDKDAFR